MPVVAWWPLLIAAWFVAGAVVGVLIGRTIRLRDRHASSREEER